MMTAAFYRIYDKPNSWIVDLAVLSDKHGHFYCDLLEAGKPISIEEPLDLKLTPSSGEERPDFCFTLLGLPLVSEFFVSVLDRLVHTQFQALSARLEGKPIRHKILNLTRKISCLARDKSDVFEIPGTDSITMIRAVLDPERIGDAELFRLAECPGYIVVSDRVRKGLLQAQVTGVTFLPVAIIEK